MKKIFKKMSAVVLALTMVLIMEIPAYADQTLHIPKKAPTTKYSSKTLEDKYYYSPIEYLTEVGNKKVTVKSSNKKVATVKVNKKYGIIFVTPKKTGKTTITVKDGKKTYKCAYTVHKYVNPIASVKIGKRTFSGMFFARPFWRKLQNIFGECCISKLAKVAKLLDSLFISQSNPVG